MFLIFMLVHNMNKEIELDDQIHSFTYAKQKLPKKESKVKTIERIVEHR